MERVWLTGSPPSKMRKGRTSWRQPPALLRPAMPSAADSADLLFGSFPTLPTLSLVPTAAICHHGQTCHCPCCSWMRPLLG